MLRVGRHSAKRPVSTYVGYGVAALAAVSAGSLVVGTAHAEPGADWIGTARCESSLNWSIHTGSFEGGLQFTPSTWLAYGGAQYAQHAYQATPAQQIAIAEKVLASQGPRAWPTCFRAGSTSPGGSISQPVKQLAPPNVSAPKHAASALPAYTGPTVDYVVVVDDTLAQIAVAHGIDDWQLIAAANPGLADPDQIQVGQQLKLPAPAVMPLGQPQPVKLSPPAVELKAVSTPTVTAVGTSGGVAARVVAAALGKRGVMYEQLDCSALIQTAFRAAGVMLPRIAADQATMGRLVSMSDLRPGDTLYYNYGKGISHTSLYIGNGQIVESSQSGHPIAVRAVYFGKYFAGARRIVG